MLLAVGHPFEDPADATGEDRPTWIGDPPLLERLAHGHLLEGLPFVGIAPGGTRPGVVGNETVDAAESTAGPWGSTSRPLAQTRFEIRDLLAHHPRTAGRDRLVVPYRTDVYWTRTVAPT